MAPPRSPAARPEPGAHLQCPGCGAPVPITGMDKSRCLFCLRETDVPDHLARPVEEADEIEERVEEAARELQAARHGARSGRFARLRVVGILMGTGAFALGTTGVSLFASGGLKGLQKNPMALLGPVLIVSIYGGMGASMVLGVLGSAVAERLRLRSVPFAVVRTAKGIEARCPNCAAGLVPLGKLTATCGGCGTEALLPAPLVSAELQARHHKLAMAHKHTSGFHRGQQRAAAVAQLGMGCVMGGVGLVAMVAIPVIMFFASKHMKMSPAVMIGSAALPVVILGGTFGMNALTQFWTAVKMWRAAGKVGDRA